MKFGTNFGHPPIETVRHGLKKQIKDHGTVWRLEGVCETEEEKDSMLIQACNGRRRLRTERKGNYIGIYVA